MLISVRATTTPSEEDKVDLVYKWTIFGAAISTLWNADHAPGRMSLECEPSLGKAQFAQLKGDIVSTYFRGRRNYD
jgi:hypothetical protein